MNDLKKVGFLVIIGWSSDCELLETAIAMFFGHIQSVLPQPSFCDPAIRYG